MVRVLSAIFGKPEEINGHNRCPTYLYRWTLFKFQKLLSIYLHHFVADDWSLDLHDHPKRFISVGLRGGYVEHQQHSMRIFHSPWVRTFPANHIHRLEMFRSPSGLKDCWTLVVVLRATRQWGFWHLGQFIHWRKYVEEIGGPADEMKSCD